MTIHRCYETSGHPAPRILSTRQDQLFYLPKFTAEWKSLPVPAVFLKMEFNQNQYFGRTIDEIRDLDVSLWL